MKEKEEKIFLVPMKFPFPLSQLKGLVQKSTRDFYFLHYLKRATIVI